MLKGLTIPLLLFIVVHTATAQIDKPRWCAVQINVVDKKTGAPLAGALVKWKLLRAQQYADSIYTDTLGRAGLMLAPNSKWQITISDTNTTGAKCPFYPITKLVEAPDTVGAISALHLQAERRTDCAGMSTNINNVYFRKKSAAIDAAQYSNLDKLALFIKNNRYLLTITGCATAHEFKDAAKQNKLARLRAENVKAYLVGQGVQASLLQTTFIILEPPVKKTTGNAKEYWRVEFKLSAPKD